MIHSAKAEFAMSSPETGTTGKRAALSDDDDGTAKRPCPPNEESSVTFMIPSGERFDLPRRTLQVRGIKDSLLARLVDSSVPTTKEAGAIKIGFECRAACFQRVVDELLWIEHLMEHNDPLGLWRLSHCGPPLKEPLHPMELRALWDYIGLPICWIGPERRHPNTHAQVLVAQAALNRGFELVAQIECFFQALASTIELRSDLLSFASATEKATLSIALNTKWRDGGSPYVNHGWSFTRELFKLLQKPAQLQELRRNHSVPDLATGLVARACTEVEFELTKTSELCVVNPTFNQCVPGWIDAASRPLGVFALAIPRRYFYDDLPRGERLAAYGAPSIKGIQLAHTKLDLKFIPRTGSAWNDGTDGDDMQIDLDVSATVHSDAPGLAVSKVPSVILKHCGTFHSIHGDEDSIKAHQGMRRVFFPQGSATSKLDLGCSISEALVSYAAASDCVDPTTVHDETSITSTPWASRDTPPQRFGPLYCPEIGRKDAAEKQRAKIDFENAGADGLGGDDSFGFISVVFALSELDALPALELVDVDEDAAPTSAEDLIILEVSSA